MRSLVTSVTLLALLTLLGAALPVWAQDGTDEPELDVIVLVPHTDEAFGIETVVPDGWTDLGNGIFGRQTTPADTTVIAQQSAPLRADALLNALLPQLALTDAPESVGTYPGGALEWTLYEVNVNVDSLNLKIDLALAEQDGVTYLVLLQTSPEDYEALHASVFLRTLDAFMPLEVEEEPVPYNVAEVTFDNGDVTLAGTLTLPPTDGPHPALVLVTGSGPQNRDESLGTGIAIRPFRLLADALTREGIAVLRYDDRGVGESTGDFATATTQDFASDAEAAIAYLLGRDDINPDEIGLLGHSEGGLVAAMLGARNPDLDFIISMAGPGVNGRDVLLLQNQLILAAEGATEDEIAAQMVFLDEMFTVLDDPEAMEALIYETALEQIKGLSEEEAAALGDDAEAYAQMVAAQMAQEYTAGWFKSFLEYDPAPDWAQTTVPVLALFGGKDVQVDAEQNAPPLEAALQQAGNEDYTIVILPDANHLFQQAKTGSTSEYGELPAEFTPDFLPTIIDWLLDRVTVAA